MKTNQVSTLLTFFATLTSCQQWSRPSELNTQAVSTPSGMIDMTKGKRMLQYRLVSAQGKTLAKLVPKLNYDFKSDFRHFKIEDYHVLVTEDSRQVKFSNADYKAKSGNTSFSSLSAPELSVISPSSSSTVTWQLGGKESITGTLVADYSIIDPDPPMKGDEVYVYFSGGRNGPGFLNVKAFKYKITSVHFDAFWKTSNGPNKMLLETLTASAEPVNGRPWSLEYVAPSSFMPVYKVGLGSKEMLYGFVIPNKDGNGTKILSIHSLALRDIVKSRHEPICSIASTPAYEQWWRNVYCSASSVKEAIDLDARATEKTCALSGTSAQAFRGDETFGELKRCGEGEALRAIEEAVKNRASSLSDSPKTPYMSGQCTSKWAKLAEELSSQYYQQYGSATSSCDGAAVDRIIRQSAKDSKPCR